MPGIASRASPMDYVDPHHKRITFTAAAVSAETQGSRRQLTFVAAGKSAPTHITLAERGTALAAIVDGVKDEFIVRKIQILDRSQRLTLDFAENTTLRRASIDIEKLDANALDTELKQLVVGRSLLYFRHQV